MFNLNLYNYKCLHFLQTIMKFDALTKIMGVIEEELKGPVDQLKRLLGPFIEAFMLFKDIIKMVKDGWSALIKGYVDLCLNTTYISEWVTDCYHTLNGSI